MVRVAVVRIVGVVPVEQRVVEPDFQPLRAERLEKLAHKVAVCRCVRRLEVGGGGVEQAEAVVVLGGQHRVLHPRLSSHPRPLAHIAALGVKLVEKRQILLLRHPLDRPHPLAARGYRVQSPVDEHPEPRVAKPRDPLFIFLSVELVHRIVCHHFTSFCTVPSSHFITLSNAIPARMTIASSLAKPMCGVKTAFSHA